MNRLEKLYYLSAPSHRFRIENHPEFGMEDVTSADFSRNDKFQLQLEIIGTIGKTSGVQILGDGRPGTFLKGSTMPTYVGENDIFTFRYEFCHAKNEHTHFPANKQTVVLEPFKAIQIRKNIQQPNRYTVLYFLNGLDRAKLNYSFHFRAERASTTKVKFKESDFVSLEDSEFETVAVQPLIIGGYQAYFGATPKQYSGETETSFLLIEGDFELAENRPFSIGRFLSLILGAEFFALGYARLDNSLRTNYMEQVNVHEAYFDNFSKHCPQPILPVGMTYQESRVHLGETISQLYESYFQRITDFNLNVISWYIIQSFYLPLEIQLQPLAAAFDMLTDLWFKSCLMTHASRDMMDSEFQAIISDLLITAELRLKGIPNHERIINRMKYANNWGHSERGKAFLHQLGISLSPDEKKILAFRHAVVHGGNHKHDAEGIYRMTNGYRSLLSRIILKILDHKGKYIDYANLDYPSREIDESIQVKK